MQIFRKIQKIGLILLVSLSFFSSLSAQDFMMQGWYWDYPKTCDGFDWASTLDGQAADIGSAGFTYLWLPPMSRASFGSCSNGYDPQDLYDLGEYGQGPTGFGTRGAVDDLITALGANGVEAVADVVYNHRDGGVAEVNQAVKDYITLHYNDTKNPFPSDRYRCVLPLGGASGNGAGDYYFKISSKSQSNRFHNKAYSVYMETSVVGFQGSPAVAESEPNGGGDCGETFNSISLGVDVTASIDAAGCTVDEFNLTLTAADFAAAGDELIIYLTNPNGDYSDHRIYGIWNATAASDVVGQLLYQTYTDFTTMPSGQGGMDFENFSPNTANTETTSLGGDWDWLWFFYDYDQTNTNTQSVLFDWTKWLWNDVGVGGFRMDAVKHFDPAFIGELMNELHSDGIDPGLVVGEVFDGNPSVLLNWVSGVEANMNSATLNNIDVRVFDFALRNALKNASDLFGYDVRNVFNSGIVDGASGNAFNTVTFLNNHDFRGPGEPIQNNPILGYAYLLTNNQIGLPTVFYPDYYGSTIPNAPTVNLKAEIDELIQIHKDHIFGAPSVDYLSRLGTPYSSSYTTGFDNTTLLYQIGGGPSGKELIVVINYAGETLVVDHQINMDNVDNADVFEDLTGNANLASATLNGSNQLHLEIPAQSYAVFLQNDVAAPVDLLNFTANAKTESVLLQWEVANEEDLEAYVIERSLDGRRFEQIAKQAAIHPFAIKAQYTFEDFNLERGVPYFYRLKMKDWSGEEAYSSIRQASLAANDFAPAFSPNPVGADGLLEWQSEDLQNFEIKVYHASGKLIWSKPLPRQNGMVQEVIPSSAWAPGIYYLHLQGQDQDWVQRVVKF